jgi:hypothetical protein
MAEIIFIDNMEVPETVILLIFSKEKHESRSGWGNTALMKKEYSILLSGGLPSMISIPIFFFLSNL